MSNQKWAEVLHKILAGSKYIWHGASEINSEEYYGLDDQMGYFDHVIDFVSEVEKRAYMAGFLDGATEVVKETEPESEVDKGVNQITAERRYLQWR